MLGPYRLADGPMMPAPPNPRWRRLRRRVLRWGAVALMGLALVLAHRPLLVGFARWFRVDDPAPSDALVVLLGHPGHRPAKAAALYREGLAPLVLLGDSASDPALGHDETEATRAVLIRLGVPPEAIRILPGAVTSTREEALRFREFARSQPLRRVTVVTSAYHTARARRIFRKTLAGMAIDVRMAAAPVPGYDETDWFKTDEGLVDYVNETIKTVYYWLSY
jgi:uncharacterized SAM-binding protein YcdF (DUF218 family)